MSFGAPQWFWGLLLIPVLIALFAGAEQRGARRLQEFVSARLLPQLAATVNRPRRIFRFALQLAGLALIITSLAQPRWGYTFEDVKRKGLDLLIAIDTSRSMLSNDVAPNRLERVKLTAHDLIGELKGDRVGLIAFAGRAFLQAPLTIDYAACSESISDIDTKTIPEGGTNISEAITLATTTFGKSAIGNRALIIFTDGEELSGDALRSAKAASDAGVRIFTIGVGTPQGSLIPIPGESGGTAFVKDSGGQVVKSKLDEKVLGQIAKVAGGFYLHLENGPRTMQQLYNDGLGKMQAAEIDARLSSRSIERYEWPLGAALVVLALSILVGERKRTKTRSVVVVPAKAAVAVSLMLAFSNFAHGAAPGIDAYRNENFQDAFTEFQETLKTHPNSQARDELEFDSGAAAYKMKNYGKALELFSQALLSPDTGLQGKSHYNLGNTLYQRGEEQKNEQKKLTDWTNALNHYQQTLKIDPNNKEAKENYEFVKRKIEDLKKTPPPTPTPSPSPSPQQNKQDQQNQQSDQQQQQSGDSQQEQQQQQDQQSQDQKSQQDNKQDKKDQSQSKDEEKKSEQQKSEAGQTPSPTPGDKDQSQKSDEGEEPSPTPGGGSPGTSPSPSPSQGAEQGASPSPGPSGSPQKKLAGELKEAGEQKPGESPSEQTAEIEEVEPEKEGQMSERQALALLQSMKDEEARVRLDERKAARHVYKDW